MKIKTLLLLFLPFYIGIYAVDVLAILVYGMNYFEVFSSYLDVALFSLFTSSIRFAIALGIFVLVRSILKRGIDIFTPKKYLYVWMFTFGFVCQLFVFVFDTVTFYVDSPYNLLLIFLPVILCPVLFARFKLKN